MYIRVFIMSVMVFFLSLQAMESSGVAVLDSQLVAQGLLQDAIMRGNKEEVANAVRSGASLITPDAHQRTAIGNTVYYGHKNLMRFIVRNFDNQLRGNYDVLFAKAVELFSRKDVKNNEKKQEKMLGALEELAKRVPSLQNILGDGALSIAIRARNEGLLELLLRHGAEPHGTPGLKARTPLSQALKKDQRLATLLIMYGADVSQLKKRELKKLHSAGQNDKATKKAKQARKVRERKKALSAAPAYLKVADLAQFCTTLEIFGQVTHLDLQEATLESKKECAAAFIKLAQVLTQLRILNVSCTGFTGDHLEALQDAHLEELNASRCSKLYPAALRSLEYFKALRVLNVSHNDMDWWIALKYISEVPNLQDLDISYNKFGAVDDAEYLSKMVTLVRLNFACNKLTVEMIKKLKALVNLRELNASYCYLRGEELTEISNIFKDLTHLNIAYNCRAQISVEHIRNLEKLKKLEELNIEGNGLGYEGTLALLEVVKASMPNFKRLVLAKNTMLKSRTEFNADASSEGLVIFQNTLYKASLLEALKQLTTLEELDISENELSAEEIASFEKALPKVKITHNRFIYK